MGRADPLAFTQQWAARARELGAVVDFEPGWEARGNGSAANYEGALVHHTAFVSSPGNPFPARSTLLNGRKDLPGPLANVAGPWCPPEAPRLIVVCARPANHAGASGGRSMGPLPVTNSFNARVFGLEIDYSGMAPMAPGQYRAALIFSRAVCDVLGRSVEYVRAHAETSTTGKWDPGYANGKTIDMAAFRRDVANFAPQGDDDMAFTEVERVVLNDVLREVMAARRQELPMLAAQLAGLTSALQQVAAGRGQSVDLDAIRAAAQAGAEAALASGVDVAVTVGGQAAGK